MVNAGVGFASSQKGRCGFLQFVKFGSAHLVPIQKLGLSDARS
jgi:hypothetical protein